MRVVIAPDCFGGTLTAAEAADAIARGWVRGAPGHEPRRCPLADGGPGFVDVLHAALGGTVQHTSVTGPLGEPVDARWLLHDGTAYLESAEAIGLHLVPAALRASTCETATSTGVGELIMAARTAHTIVVGLGGSATTDGGRGALTAIHGQLPRLIAAADVENPLLGPHGAAATFGPQKGADPAAVQRLEAALTRHADEVAQDHRLDPRDEPGAGAAGGLGFALLALGAEMASGARIVRDATGLDQALDGAGLAITGEGSFDWQSLRGKLVTSVADAAARRGIPCLVLAGQVDVGRRQAAAAGVEEAHSVAEHAGSVAAALADPAGTLAALAQHVARQWR
ncbi:glycerate kinase [Actinokineospora sp. NBRC 105648]|uniref:glycerate kinase family protein n=1 Tax=Actinokineospora sp. NBRC 105648 TaxID=3032206 RepID=UPI0024A15FE1|nr:glycerate kinase [Actinokineospora sp. NBRC 105648]GLZ39166.1 putative glycerate kinase [Actinokineospora sp. NBRC 105648]